MMFSSAVFIFAYLPVVFLGYYALPKKFAPAFLFLMNLVFYGWGEPVYLLLMLFSIAFNYGAALLIPRFQRKKAVFAISVAVNVALIGYFKYSGFFVSTVSGALSSMASSSQTGLLTGGQTGLFSGFTPPSLPIGISFYTFQAISYLADIYRGVIQAERSLLKFGSYISLFPQLNAGPIVRYSSIAEQLGKRGATSGDIEIGLKKFVCGLSKKLLIANPVGHAWEAFASSAGQNGFAGAWIGMLAYAFHIYFDFSGYSDMAVGLGKMLGFSFPENFNYPYVSKSITEFWRRWHMTLSGWFRDYVYIPLGGSRRGAAGNLFNLAAVWFLTGLWHGASWNFVLWGVYFAVLLLAERAFIHKVFDKIKLPVFLRRLYAFGFVIIGWGLFSLTDLSKSFAYLAEMFGATHIGDTIGNIADAGIMSSGADALAGGAVIISSGADSLAGGAGWFLFSPGALRYAVAYIPTLMICAVAATPLPKRLWNTITADGRKFRALEGAGTVILLLLCIAAITAGGYNPFIYLRF